MTGTCITDPLQKGENSTLYYSFIFSPMHLKYIHNYEAIAPLSQG